MTVAFKEPLHVLHVAASLGPESAAGRLCTALASEGCRISTLGLRPPAFTDGMFFSVSSFVRKWHARTGRVLLRLHPQRDKTMPWALPWCGYSLRQWVRKLRPDIVHLHWVADSTVDLRSLNGVGVPVVWTFHDMWPLTAGCHYPIECEQWCVQCDDCPQLGTGIRGGNLTPWAWRYKRAAYEAAQVHAIAPSRWMADMARRSPLWQGHGVRQLGNALDTAVFRPQDMAYCRSLWGLPEDKPILLFGATATSIPYKGFALLQEALDLLKAQGQDLHLAVFGEHAEGVPLPYPVTCIGFVDDPERLATLYAAADVFVAPSKQDNLPTTLLEASACGTPCVAFDIGGIADIVLHNENGYLARPFDTVDLAHGISFVLDNPATAHSWGVRARQHVVSNFESGMIAKQHIGFYKENIFGAPE